MSYGPQKAQQGSSGPLCRFLAVWDTPILRVVSNQADPFSL
jgi:hypothetical protein